MLFHRLLGSASCRFFQILINSAACCLKNARGAVTCGLKVDIIVRQEANDYLPVEAYNSV